MAAVALVTGGTGGIGRAICARLAAAGYIVAAGDVAVTDVAVKLADQPGSDQVAAGQVAAGRVVDFPLDVTDQASIAGYVTAAAALGPITGLVNCAGVLREARADDMPAAAAAAM